jgi:3-hydroxybutyrate dehydrogenase
MLESATKLFGKIDILVNNAGIQHVAPIDDFPPEKWELIIRVNLISAFYTIRHVLPLMKENKWGRIVNIASLHGVVASPFKSAYVSAKHGILGLTKTVALEVAEKNITVNSICPGYVKTPLVMNQLADTAKCRGISEEDVIKNVILLNQPTKKFIDLEELADTTSFLCSESARSITGTQILVDGGWTAQ